MYNIWAFYWKQTIVVEWIYFTSVNAETRRKKWSHFERNIVVGFKRTSKHFLQQKPTNRLFVIHIFILLFHLFNSQRDNKPPTKGGTMLNQIGKWTRIWSKCFLFFAIFFWLANWKRFFSKLKFIFFGQSMKFKRGNVLFFWNAIFDIYCWQWIRAWMKRRHMIDLMSLLWNECHDKYILTLWRVLHQETPFFSLQYLDSIRRCIIVRRLVLRCEKGHLLDT